MGLFRSLDGTVRLELTGADVAASLHSINEMGIPITAVEPDGELSVRFTASRRSLRDLERFAERKGERLRILMRSGLFWQIAGLRRRPLLVCGMALLLTLVLFTPSRVLFVHVEGNDRVPSRLILEAAHNAGISFGAKRRDVRSEKMKNTLLAQVPQLQWAGVNTYGSTAVISVRERESEPLPDNPAAVSNILAVCDGLITACTVTDGTALCAVGQVVQKGQVLISGYTDCGLTVTAGRAKGEIFAQTRHELTVITPSESLKRMDFQGTQTNFSLRVGKKRINFSKGSGISDGTCVKMYSEYYLTLPGGYRLPVALIKETVSTFDMQVQACEDGSELQLSKFAKDYLRDQMVALSILDAKEEFLMKDGFFQLSGQYACSEMIGREECEQIGDFHGKTD